MHSFPRNVRTFYTRDCCWPYAASFFLALIVFGLDFSDRHSHFHWASFTAFGIILSYYLYILRLYFRKKLTKENLRFFIKFLSVKVLVLGAVLLLLHR